MLLQSPSYFVFDHRDKQIHVINRSNEQRIIIISQPFNSCVDIRGAGSSSRKYT